MAEERPKLRHVAISVADADASARFYTEALGMEVVDRSDTGSAVAVHLSDGSTNIALLQTPNIPEHGLHHIGFVVEDVERSSERLVGAGAPPAEGGPPPGSAFFEVKHQGPDGVVVDISDEPWAGSLGLKAAD